MLTEDAAHELAALTGVVLSNEDVTSTHDEICRMRCACSLPPTAPR